MLLRKRYLYLFLVLASSFIAVIVAGLDTYITSEFIKVYTLDKIPWLFGLSTFIVGTFVTLILCFILSIPIKKRKIGSILDPSFNGLRFIKKNELKYHLLAGFGNSISTIGYFYVLCQFIDPSAVLPFTEVVILYLLIIESVSEKNSPTLIEVQSCIMVMFGAILGSISLTGEFNFKALAIMFLVVNIGIAMVTIYQRKLKLKYINDKPNDSINIRIWNLIFTLIFTIIISYLFDILYGSTNLKYGFDASIQFFWLIAISMLITFLSVVLYIRALGIGKASVTQAIRSSKLLFSLPMTFILSIFIIVPIPNTPTLIIIKIIGLILVFLGIISFALTESKAFVFIKLEQKSKASYAIEEIKKIKGIDTISVIYAEKYDIISAVRIRTLLKGYTQIIKKLENINGIESVKWISILKEYENI